MENPLNGGLTPPNDEIKWVKCDTCGKDVTCNAAYPVSQITCFRCYIEKKWRTQENGGDSHHQEAGLDEPSY